MLLVYLFRYIQKVKVSVAGGSDEDQDIIGIQLLKDYPPEGMEDQEDDVCFRLRCYTCLVLNNTLIGRRGHNNS